MARTLGFRLVSVSDGEAMFEGQAGAHLLNPLGTVHGGFALTLVDSAAGCAVHSTLPPGIGYTTVETKVNFTGAIREDDGTLRAHGKVIARGRQIATAEARVTNEAGKIVAHGTSTLIILPPRG
jgi:uncharacterized protein (TIGR00369 family)